VFHGELASRIADLEHRVGDHDGAMNELFEAIRLLMKPPPERPKEKIGFRPS
jgi:hypothetical protein